MPILVIVESAGKIKKISQILGDKYIVKASYGHIQDLDKKTLSIDIENNFKPLYIVPDDKLKIVKELKNIASKCEDIIIASDGDREGEAIAFSLANVLKLDCNKCKRIIFNEITKTAITNAIQNPIKINMNMVHSQQTRRILDRIVGYKISPIIWNYIKDAKSAGRVQSVVVKIINDREDEINNQEYKSYFKTVGTFDNLSGKSILNYHIINDEECLKFLNLINKKTIVKIINIENKKSIRNPSPPFITSTLQQESHIKLHFNIKKTMDIAQKLYEGGYITYMRTDSPNISQDAINSIKEYIINNYGKEYSRPLNYVSKNETSQDAHECIRPTDIKLDKLIDQPIENIKLYNLIWNRTIASQMSSAELNIQTIYIDLINENSILIFDDKQYNFISTFENIIFLGYLIIYNNNIDDKIDIDINTVLKINKITINEEFNKLVHGGRFCEASLVKYLEHNGIGRPSTYVSIISKIIERNYVKIKDIEGLNKEVKQYELKNFKIKENLNKIIIGKENNKIVITDMGKTVNEFLLKYFETIMNINFTASFEEMLDKIAIGKANYITILQNYYDIFNPIINKLKINIPNNKCNLLGLNTNGDEIFIYPNKYIKIFENNNWKYCNINKNNISLEEAIELLKYPKIIGNYDNNDIIINKGTDNFYIKYKNKNISINNSNITMEECIDLLTNTIYPKIIGKYNNIDIIINKSKYGLYIKYNNSNISINNENITINEAIELINNNKIFKKGKNTYNIKNGQYGYYIQVISGKNKENISIPSKYNINTITLNDILNIIDLKKK
jgi:DNA topoisomerase-1